MKQDEKPVGLALLRAPFPPNQISKLPKPTRAQTDEVKANFRAGIRCQICGTWHHPNVVHLDYVGHAALTDRLLDCDPLWNWEAVSADGFPVLDKNTGMWIRLTVCGVTRLGYGHAEGKTGGDAIKEVIGDALRNAAMRFGAALDLWHKGDLHGDDEPGERPRAEEKPLANDDAEIRAIACLAEANDLARLAVAWNNLPNTTRNIPAVLAAKDARKKAISDVPADLGGDDIPY